MRVLPCNFPETRLFTCDFTALGISNRHIESAMGYGPGQIPEEFRALVAKALEQAPSLCVIRGGYRIVSNIQVNRQEGSVWLDGKRFTSGKIITSAMQDSEAIAMMVCTAGQGLTDRIQELFATGDPVLGHIFDTIGSCAAEAIADQVQTALENEMKSAGRSITNRYSPGYCFWPVAEQHLFFSLLPVKFCDVTLTDSALMVPIKSISAIVGIGEKVIKRDYECGSCDQKDCIRRQQLE